MSNANPLAELEALVRRWLARFVIDAKIDLGQPTIDLLAPYLAEKFGTQLLAELNKIGALNDIVTATARYASSGEYHGINHNFCSCGVPWSECPEHC